jgi:hypothetical protein
VFSVQKAIDYEDEDEDEEDLQHRDTERKI